MTLEELIDELRERVGDTGTPPLCTDARATRFANEAEREAARRARLLIDSSSEPCCRIDIEAGEATYSLHPSVIAVRRVRLEGYEPFLQRTSRRDLDQLGSSWLSETGEVMAYVPDMDTGKIRFYKAPTEAAVAWLQVVRLPLEEMAQDGDEPEVHARFHEGLVSWMEYRYYSMRDEDARDPAKANAALAEFEREFGPKLSALEEQWASENYGYSSEEDGNVYGATR